MRPKKKIRTESGAQAAPPTGSARTTRRSARSARPSETTSPTEAPGTRNAAVNDNEEPTVVTEDEDDEPDLFEDEATEAPVLAQDIHQLEVFNTTAPGTTLGEQIQRDALARFTHLYAGALANALDADHSFVRKDEMMHSDQVTVPIMAVTEAIRYRVPAQYGELHHLFDVTTDYNIAVARYQASDSNFHVRSFRPGHPLLIPWIYSPETWANETMEGQPKEGQSKESGGENHADAKVTANMASSTGAHIILLLVHLVNNLCEIRIYDTARHLPFRQMPNLWNSVLLEIQNAIRNMEWLPNGTTVATLNSEGYDVRFGREVEVDVVPQSTGWSCGMHTILNAWTVAMNLVPNALFRPSEQDHDTFLNHAISMINLTVAGVVDSDLIYSFLVGYGWAMPKPRHQCPSFGTLAEEHGIRSADALKEYVYTKQSQAESERQYMRSMEIVSKQATSGPQPPWPGASDTVAGPGPKTQATREQSRGVQDISAGSSARNLVPVPHDVSYLDTMSFWNAFKQTSKYQQARNNQEAGKELLNFIVETLEPENSKDWLWDERKAYYDVLKDQFQNALAWPRTAGATPISENLRNLQLHIFKEMNMGRIVPSEVRHQLIVMYQNEKDESKKKQEQAEETGSTQPHETSQAPQQEEIDRNAGGNAGGSPGGSGGSASRHERQDFADLFERQL